MLPSGLCAIAREPASPIFDTSSLRVELHDRDPLNGAPGEDRGLGGGFRSLQHAQVERSMESPAVRSQRPRDSLAVSGSQLGSRASTSTFRAVKVALDNVY